jgi:hypothetical protein
LKRKRLFSNFAKSENFRFPGSFRENGYISEIKHLQNGKFKRKFDHFSACPLLLSDLF